MQEQAQAEVVHFVRFRKRKRLSDEPGQTLTQRVVEPLNVAGLTVAFAGRPMLFLRHDLLVGIPEVCEH